MATAECRADARYTISAVLSSLNRAQLEAVQHSPSVPLQILAGPGSGKTKVLISRIAHLILHYSVPPESICAVTFTNKAANEMRQRLNQLLGEQYTCQIKMGTFHALCALFLRKYANVIGLERNFTVCDSEESKKLVSGLLKLFKDDLATRDIILKESTVLSMISKAKARGLNATIMQKECKANKSPIPSTIDHINAVVSDIYESYEKTLRQTNSLDFDDLLLFGVKLFRNHSKAVDWCHHVLVDEFQDTNVTQYELMHQLAVRKCVTVVGDPDQSIYGWRSAEVENLSRMQKDYPQTKEIFLEENYRSTGSILNASLAIVTQDKNRIQKSLFTSHPLGSVPVLHSSISEQDEATKIAIEIKRAIAYTGGLLNYGDFAILLRFTALSRTLEGALQKEGIRSRVLGGHKFFERLEIKDLLAYLQLIDNPEYDPAFLRIANVPSRGVGEKTLDELSAKARGKKLSMLAFIEKICDNHIPDIKPPIKRKLGDFVKVMLRLKRSASEGATPPELIRQLLQQIDYENHLKRTQTDWETRWENVQELITFSSEANATDPSIVEEEEEERPTPLRLFLQASMLSSEGDSQNEENNKEKVTIVTCHAAKGLEWPVVFVPSVEDGTFPFYRTEDVEEERRLLYVACTRAQCLLYLSYAKKRKVAGETKNKVLSPFISTVKSESQPLFTDVMPQLDPAQCQELAHILGRPEPDHGEVQRQVAQYYQKYGNWVLCDVSQQDRVSQSWATEVQQYQPQIRHQAPFIPLGFVSSSQIMSPNHNGSARSPATMTHTAPAINISPETTAPRGSTRPYQTKPSVLATPLPIQSVPRRQHQVIAQACQVDGSGEVQPVRVEIKSVGATQNKPVEPIVSIGTKRRLGMGRCTTGYANKKFKPPT